MRRLLLRLLGAGLVAALVVPVAGTAAEAHGGLLDGAPGPGDAVGVGSTVLRLEFQDLADGEPAYVAILGTDVEPRPVGEAVVVDGTTVCAVSAPLTAGVHTLQYSVADTEDGRQTRNYQFEVTESGAPTEAGVCDDVDLSEPGDARTIEEMLEPGISTWTMLGLGSAAMLAAAAVTLGVRRVQRRR